MEIFMEVEKQKKKISKPMWVLIFLVLILIFANPVIHSTNQSNTTTANVADIKKSPSDIAKEAKDHIKFDYQWTLGGFNNVLLLDIELTNQNEIAVKDLIIRCNHYAQSGTIIGKSKQTLYELLPPNGKVGYLKFNMGAASSQTTSIDCRISFAKGVVK
jgi:hypothetical protein